MATPNDLVLLTLTAVTGLPTTMAWRQNTGAGHMPSGQWVTFGQEGTPDILGVRKGRAFAIECKSGTGRLRIKQRKWRIKWLSAKGIYIVARSEDQAVCDLVAAIP